MIYYVILILMTMVGSIAAYYLKKASGSDGIIHLIQDKYFYIGGILYFVSALLNIYILQYLDYSVVLPLTSITYIWTMIISNYKLHETITTKKIYGICFILVGAICVAL